LSFFFQIGYSVIEEEPASNVEQQKQPLGSPQDPYADGNQSFQRNTNEAFSSWGIGENMSSLDSQMKALNISMAGSSINLLRKRGTIKILGIAFF